MKHIFRYYLLFYRIAEIDDKINANIILGAGLFRSHLFSKYIQINRTLGLGPVLQKK